MEKTLEIRLAEQREQIAQKILEFGQAKLDSIMLQTANIKGVNMEDIYIFNDIAATVFNEAADIARGVK